MEQRIERLEERVDDLEKDMKAQQIEFAETRVYVREGYKKMNEIASALEALKISGNQNREASKSEWTKFFEKSFWLAAGAIVAFFAGKIHF